MPAYCSSGMEDVPGLAATHSFDQHARFAETLAQKWTLQITTSISICW